MSDTDWLATRNEIINDALFNIGVVPLGEDPEPEKFAIGLRYLNSLTKFLQSRNLYLWNYEVESIALVVGTASYGFANNNAIGVDEAYFSPTNGKISLDQLPGEAYRSVTDKATAGTPSRFTFDRGNTTPAITLYPVPNAAAVALYPTLYVRAARRLKDWDTAGGTPMPSWWCEPLKWLLAAALCHPFRLSLAERAAYETKARDLLGEISKDNFDNRDTGGLQFYAD